jgi:hypothetical protein
MKGNMLLCTAPTTWGAPFVRTVIKLRNHLLVPLDKCAVRQQEAILLYSSVSSNVQHILPA